ncbi:MAG: leucyl/phenylalanyl-tRNA--protein transferase [Bradymonadaceae bacterium]|nr:leucyl/phenylalanyl-tRNA--protein transferase [Lujinxingiaceae bacterium]
MKRPTAQLVLSAYAQGIFPMAHPEEDYRIYWYAPDPRAIIPLDGLIVSRRLRQSVRQAIYEIRVNTAFNEVIAQCAAPREIEAETWISEGLTAVFGELHRLGFAHSIEAWRDDCLVGGLYGVGIGGFFAGESMFFRETNASKLCLVHLVERMRARGFSLLDVQFMTAHLRSLGAVEIPRSDYESQLVEAIGRPCVFAE